MDNKVTNQHNNKYEDFLKRMWTLDDAKDDVRKEFLTVVAKAVSGYGFSPLDICNILKEIESELSGVSHDSLQGNRVKGQWPGDAAPFHDGLFRDIPL